MCLFSAPSPPRNTKVLSVTDTSIQVNKNFTVYLFSVCKYLKPLNAEEIPSKIITAYMNHESWCVTVYCRDIWLQMTKCVEMCDNTLDFKMWKYVTRNMFLCDKLWKHLTSNNLSCPGGSLPEPMEWSRSQNQLWLIVIVTSENHDNITVWLPSSLWSLFLPSTMAI